MEQEQIKGIRRRGDRWLVDVTVRGRRTTATCDTYKEAVAKRKAIKEAATTTAHRTHKSPQPAVTEMTWTISEAFEATRDRVWRQLRSAKHLISNGQSAVDYFGPRKRLGEIGSAQIDEWIEWMERQHMSNATINRKLAALSKMFTFAHQRGGVLHRPYFPRRKEANGRIRYLSDAEEAEVLATFEHFGLEEHREAVIVLLDTGMRCGELLGLTAQDVDLKANILSIWQNKADHPRSIPLTQRVRSILADKVKAARPTERLFPHDHWWLRNAWDRVRSHLGLTNDPQFVPHVLRHTCASRLVQRGAPIRVVQEWLGHKTISQTMRYSHLAPKNLVAAAELLESRDMVG